MALSAPSPRVRRALANWLAAVAACLAVAAPAAWAETTAGIATAGAASEAAPIAPAPLLVEAEFSAPAGWVQAQAIYTLRLLQAVSFADLEFSPPRPRLAEFRPLGEAIVSEAQRGGLRYRVVERRYAVFPFASGELLAEGATVSGIAVGADGSVGRRALTAPPARLAVSSLPASAAPTRWLPARSVTLAERWSPPPAEARAGQPLTRTLRVEAQGVDAAQIPELQLAIDGISAPAGPPRLTTRVDGDWVVGVREQSWRVLPRAAGALTLPAISLAWWDAAAGMPRVAVLPARTLPVAAASAPGGAVAAADSATPVGAQSLPSTLPAAGSAPPAAAPAAADSAPAGAPAEAGVPAAGSAAASSAAAAHGASGALTGLSAQVWATALAVAVAATLGLTLIRRRWLGAAIRRASAWRRLRRACRQAEPATARDALLAWAALRDAAPPPRTLAALAERLDEAARAPVLALDRHCYGPPEAAWDGAGLLRALRRARAARSPRRAPADAGADSRDSRYRLAKCWKKNS